MQNRKDLLLKKNLKPHNRIYNKSRTEFNFGKDVRFIILNVFLVFFFSLILIKLFYIQVIKHEDYKIQASKYQDLIEKIPAKRGEIYIVSNKDIDLKSIKVYNSLNIDKLDKIAVNIYKYNVIFNPRMFVNYDKISSELINIFGKKVLVDKTELENKLYLLNNPENITDKFLEILYPELYPLKEIETKITELTKQKSELENKINNTKNKTTLKKLQDSLYSINMALKIDDETKQKIAKLDDERSKIYSKITKENDAYEIIKRDIEESQMESIVDYFQNIYIKEIGSYISILNSETKKNQIKNFYKIFLTFEQNESRLYPDSNLYSQTTGFFKITEKEVTLKDGSTKYEKDGQGVYGIEGHFNKELKGEDGQIMGKYDSSGKLIATADRVEKESKDGVDIVLTIDKSIQYHVCKALNDAVNLYEAEGGSVLVMNPNNGDILAMCNNPTFDANQYSKVDDIYVYNNPIISDQVEFGSIMKVVTVAAGIDTGAISAYSTYEDTGCSIIGDWPKPICNADYKSKGAHGETDMVTVLDKSLNLGAWYVANKIGKNKFQEYVHNFGFGEKTGIELGNEVKGDFRNLDKINNQGGDIYLATASFGQGITMTQIQYLTAFSSIINGGNLMRPHIIKATIDNNGNIKEKEPEIIRKTIKEETSSIMRGMLTSVVEKGYDKLAQVKGYYVGGKTGTAQVPENGVYGKKTMQSFVGFGPISNPRFAILIKLKNPKTEFASYSCTPVFFDIAKYLFDYYQIPPDKQD